jgi:HEAT repeat protein
MCGRLEGERDASVRSVIFTSLIKLKTRTVVELLAPYLRSEDAALRNAVVEALQEMPEDIEPFMDSLLSDPDSDVRISAVTILGALAHPRVPEWLSQVIQSDPHINVCAAALDCLAEAGDEEAVPLLEGLAHRFPDEPYINFAVAAAIRRIKGE